VRRPRLGQWGGHHPALGRTPGRSEIGCPRGKPSRRPRPRRPPGQRNAGSQTTFATPGPLLQNSTSPAGRAREPPGQAAEAAAKAEAKAEAKAAEAAAKAAEAKVKAAAKAEAKAEAKAAEAAAKAEAKAAEPSAAATTRTGSQAERQVMGLLRDMGLDPSAQTPITTGTALEQKIDISVLYHGHLVYFEIDGPHHECPANFRSAIQRIRDIVKHLTCLEREVPLLRISVGGVLTARDLAWARPQITAFLEAALCEGMRLVEYASAPSCMSGGAFHDALRVAGTGSRDSFWNGGAGSIYACRVPIAHALEELAGSPESNEFLGLLLAGAYGPAAGTRFWHAVQARISPPA
jgi:hypothetical protein